MTFYYSLLTLAHSCVTLIRKFVTLDRKYVTLSDCFARYEYKSPGIVLKSRSNVPMLLSNGPELVSYAVKSLCNASLQVIYAPKYVTCVPMSRTYEPLFASYAIMLASNGPKLVSNAAKSLCNGPLQVTYTPKYVTCVLMTRTCVPLFMCYAAMLVSYATKLAGSNLELIYKQVKVPTDAALHASYGPLWGRDTAL